MGGRTMLSADLRYWIGALVLGALSVSAASANNLADAAQANAAAVSAAQQAYAQVGKVKKGQKVPDMRYVPQYMRPLYNNLDPSQLTAAQREGLGDVQRILKRTPLVPRATRTVMSQQWAQSLGKKGMGIADASLAENRAKVLRFLGFKPQDANHLFYFVSFSMPTGMLRAYAEQALWDGGILVFKGPLPHVQLAKFITQDLNGLVGLKGASATVTIDPRLYDVFKITQAPTIVYSTVPENQVCRKVHLQPFTYARKRWTYPVCDQVNPKEYWKIEGAVTSEWALRQFRKAGAPGVSAYLTALAKGHLGQQATGQAQAPYKGSWATAPSPVQMQAIQNTVARFGEQAYRTPFGLGVGPSMKITPGQGITALPYGSPGIPGEAATGTSRPAPHTAVKDGVAYRAP